MSGAPASPQNRGGSDPHECEQERRDGVLDVDLLMGIDDEPDRPDGEQDGGGANGRGEEGSELSAIAGVTLRQRYSDSATSLRPALGDAHVAR